MQTMELSRTDDRFGSLEGKVDETNRKVDDLDRGMHAEFRSVRAEIKKEALSVRAEIKNEGLSVRTEIKNEARSIRAEMKDEFRAFRGEIKDEFRAFRGEIKDEFRDFRGEMNLRFDSLEDRVAAMTRTMLATALGGLFTLLATIIATQL
jgi:hypothetical protein